ncbi:MAG TPA: CHAT domain-containing protein [Cyclobacteriaceae bacterium]|jgi:CHAT domain-containing protein|nr:CHAT domain-containing protein [Cyclobacteriaceae bacterium]
MALNLMFNLLRRARPRQRIYVLFLTLVSQGVFSQTQDWQSLYNAALTKYQSENFQGSFQSAKDALQMAGTISPLNRARTIQLITASCVALENPDDGLTYVDEEINLFRQTEGSKSKSLAEALKKQVLFLQQKNQLKLALEKASGISILFADSYGPTSLQTLQFNILWGDLALANKDSLKAKQLWNKCIPLLANNTEAIEDYKAVLYNTAELEEKQKDKSAAEAKYTDLIKFLEKENQTDDPIYEGSKKAIQRLQHAPAASGSSELQLLLRKAITLQSQNQFNEAVEAFRRCVETVKQQQAQDKLAFSVYFNYARLLIDHESLRDGNDMLQKAKNLAGALFKSGDLENFLMSLTDADLALALGQKKDAIIKYNSLMGKVKNQPKALSYLISSGNQLLNNDLPAEAAKLLRPAVFSSEQNSDEFFEKAAATYCNALLGLNKPDSLLLFLNRPALKDKLWTEFKKIEAFQQKGQWAQALDKISKLKSLPSTSDREKGEIAFQSATLAYKMGDYILAEENYLKAQKYLEAVSQQDVWQVNNSLAILYSKIGNFEKSQKIITDLLTKVPDRHPLHLTLLTNLSANYIDTNELAKANSTQEKIIGIEKATVGEAHPDYAQAITNLAVLYQKEGRYADAKNLLLKALTVSRDNFGEQSTDFALKESALGAVQKDAGDFSQALTSLSHAEGILSERLGTTHPDYVSCEYNLALVFLRTGDAGRAMPFMEHLASFYKKQILEFFPAMNEQEQVSLYNKVNHAIQDYQQFAMEYGNRYPSLIEHLFDFRLATKALLLNSSAKTRALILQGGDTPLKAQFLSWISLKDQIGKLYGAGAGAATEDQVAGLEAQANDLEKKLSQSSSIFKKNTDERDATWSRIQAKLGDKEAAVEFIRVKASGKSDSVSYAALVSRKDRSKPQLVVFGAGRKMEGREFSYYKNTMVHRVLNSRSYGIFWKPLEAALSGVSKVYVSADGVYNKINPSTLFDPAENKYLNNKYQVVLVSSLRDLTVENAAVNSGNKSVQLFAPVNFGDGPSISSAIYRSIASSQINSLPGTKTEIEKIDQILKNGQWSSVPHVGKDASESEIKATASAGIIHIATHGFFVNDNEEGQPVVMDADRGNDNPLFRSGLVLAGSATDDGVLTAYEVKNLNFDKTDLVVLSACETGSGEIRNGEGVYGLQRAFLISGVKNVLMSLWKVDDEATQELMVTFYNNLLSNSNKTEALRQAQMELMKKYPDPFFWGGFVLISRPN